MSRNLSQCEVVSCQIVNEFDPKRVEDIAQFITGFEISQSMEAHQYQGFLEIEETVGLLENLPLRAEETLLMTIISSDMPYKVVLETRVIRISDITPMENTDGAVYKMHFVSKETFNANKRKVIKAYNGQIHEIAKRVFQTYYAKVGGETEIDQLYGQDFTMRSAKRYDLTESTIVEEDFGQRKFYLQDTFSATGLTVPRYTPAYTMNLLASMGFNTNVPSCTYRFFETLESYYWVTDEFFIHKHNAGKIKHLYYGPVGSMDPNRPLAQLERIEQLQVVNKGLDTATDIFSGAYRSRVTEIDIVRKQVTDYNFNYDEDADYMDFSGNQARQSRPDAQPHTQAFRDETFTEENARHFVVYKDYQSVGDIKSNIRAERFVPTITQNRVSYYHHLNNVQVKAALKGRLDLRPGEIIQLDIAQLNVDSKRNDTLGGKYMIKTTSHQMKHGELTTSLLLVKFDWSATDSRTDQGNA